MKKLSKKIMMVIIVTILFCGLVGCGGSGSSRPASYDGKNACLNCGKKSVYDLGFCKSCYKSFMKYTYGD